MGNNRSSLLFRLLCIILLNLVGPGCNEDKQKVIDEKVGRQVSEFRERKQAECRRNALAKAEKIVDSLLLAEAQQALQDSLGRIRPSRPVQPPEVPAIDSAGINPIFTPRKGN